MGRAASGTRLPGRAAGGSRTAGPGPDGVCTGGCGGGGDPGVEPWLPGTGGRFSLATCELVPAPRGHSPGALAPPPATVQRADGTSTHAFRLSNEPGGGQGVGGPKALQPYLPSLGSTVTPSVSARISQMSTNLLMLGKVVSFCLPGREAESWPGARGCPLPPTRPGHDAGPQAGPVPSRKRKWPGHPPCEDPQEEGPPHPPCGLPAPPAGRPPWRLPSVPHRPPSRPPRSLPWTRAGRDSLKSSRAWERRPARPRRRSTTVLL